MMNIAPNTLEDKIEKYIVTFKYKINFNEKFSNTLNLSYNFSLDENVSYYNIDSESSFEYLLFSLFCFKNKSFEDISELLTNIVVNNNCDFLLSEFKLSNLKKLAKYNNWYNRKKHFNDEEYSKKHLEEVAKEEAKNKKIIQNYQEDMIKDLEATEEVTEELNISILDVLKDEDISSSNRIKLIKDYTKTSINLIEKKEILINKLNLNSDIS